MRVPTFIIIIIIIVESSSSAGLIDMEDGA